MQFRAEQYYQASVERMRQARDLCEQEESWALVMYCAGLAVECMLRAFRWRIDTSFEGRHDLNELYKASRLLPIAELYQQQKHRDDANAQAAVDELRTAMGLVINLWHNNLRFASEDGARAHLKQIRRDRGVKGDFLKKNAKDMVEAAQIVIDQGRELWTSGIK